MVLLGLVLLLVVAVVLMRLPTTTIPSVGTTVEAGEIIETSDLVEISWPVNAVYPDLITEPGELVGRRAVTRINANQPVSRPMLTMPNATTADAPVDPRYLDFDANKLQYFLPVDLRRTSGGLVQNGDWVNILQVGEGGSRFILQKIHVIGARGATGQDLSAPSTDPAVPAAPIGVPTGFMLALTPDQMQTLIALPPEQVHLIKTTPDAPDLPGVATGLEMYNPGDGGPSLPEGTPAPSPAEEPGDEPGGSTDPSAPAEPGETATPSETAQCDANYEGDCVPVFAGQDNVNCEDVQGPIAVIGDDPYNLDEDGNGTACEAEAYMPPGALAAHEQRPLFVA